MVYQKSLNMNTSIHIPDALAQRLNEHLEKLNRESNISRNAIIVEAIRDWLNKQEPVVEWSDEVKQWCSQSKNDFDLAREEQDWGDFSL